MRLQRLLREPLLHFFVLGALVFGVFRWASDSGPASTFEIEVDSARIELLRQQFERARQRLPTESELAAVVEGWVRQEILYREGISMGIDEGDSFIRRRVAQKVSFLAETMVDTTPTDAELQVWLSANAGRYEVDARYSFRQIYVDPGRHGGDLERVLASMEADLAAGQADAIGDRTSLPSAMVDASASEIERKFGRAFAIALGDLQTGKWHGILQSGYGLHFVFLDESTPGRAPALTEVRAEVERDLIEERIRTADDVFYQTLRDRYTIRIDGGTAPSSADPGAQQQ